MLIVVLASLFQGIDCKTQNRICFPQFCHNVDQLNMFYTFSSSGMCQILATIRPYSVSKKFHDFSSHRIFGCMHEALNINKKITNCTVYL